MNSEQAILARLDDLNGRMDRNDEHVNARMDRLEVRQEKEGRDTRKQVTDVLVAVAGLRVKAGIWGAVAGLIPSAILAMYFLMRVMAD